MPTEVHLKVARGLLVHLLPTDKRRQLLKDGFATLKGVSIALYELFFPYDGFQALVGGGNSFVLVDLGSS